MANYAFYHLKWRYLVLIFPPLAALLTAESMVLWLEPVRSVQTPVTWTGYSSATSMRAAPAMPLSMIRQDL